MQVNLAVVIAEQRQIPPYDGLLHQEGAQLLAIVTHVQRVGEACSIEQRIHLEPLVLSRVPLGRARSLKDLPDPHRLGEIGGESGQRVEQGALAATVGAEQEIDAAQMQLEVREAPEVVDVDPLDHRSRSHAPNTTTPRTAPYPASTPADLEGRGRRRASSARSGRAAGM